MQPLALLKEVKNVGKDQRLHSLKLTASLHLEMDGWKTIVSFWGPADFQGLLLLVSGECIGGGFKEFFIFTPHLGDMIQFDYPP